MWAARRYTSRTLRRTRLLSSGPNPYPYPTHENPNPYQIFHLPHNASQAEIKKRYIDLVRIYHPDSPVSRALPSEITDGRFQSITKAYDALRLKSPMMPGGVQNNLDASNPAAFRPRQSRRIDLDTGGDDRWKDRIILFGVLVTIVGFVAQTMATRREALAEMQHQTSHVPRMGHSQRTEDSALAASPPDENQDRS